MKIKVKFSRTTGNAESSPQLVASIDDLLTEILLRLPMKSLIRFKLVSKHWHSLITNPKFCIFRNPNPNPAIGLFLHCSDFRSNPRIEYVPFSHVENPPFKKLKFANDPSGIRIVQSCNGLLLCSSSRARDYNRIYYVYNPTTNKYTTLPKLGNVDGISTRSKIHGMSLAFDPTKSPHYKVVCVRGSLVSGEYHYQFEVYSSETGPWRKCGEPFTAQVKFGNGVYWNGAIHWISHGRTVEAMYFDTERRMLQTMPMPPIEDGWDWWSNYYFGESCDQLHYVEIAGPQIRVNVYEMRRDYSEWFAKYKVDLAPVVAAYPGMIRNGVHPTDWYYYDISVLSMVRGEKEEGSFLVLQIAGQVVRYNHVNQDFETIHEFCGAEVEGDSRLINANGYQYIESLWCV
ncbi:hypothetical protein CASFOL_006799 [Castilleja foliolosa]|uniref:F-box domain-containing protein n=1 Tax=Castilleja foliolosa TaxID=1961234 RepID=A0ABD3EBA4_9LAMI